MPSGFYRMLIEKMCLHFYYSANIRHNLLLHEIYTTISGEKSLTFDDTIKRQNNVSDYRIE
jgi:hypothetical protein